ncbi:hypothetical protein FBY01_118129 [Pseudomonas sp. SJZ077]|nr:hypothetical protein FBY01_118129 [Pseudomonas sp. SJZ077]
MSENPLACIASASQTSGSKLPRHKMIIDLKSGDLPLTLSYKTLSRFKLYRDSAE